MAWQAHRSDPLSDDSPATPDVPAAPPPKRAGACACLACPLLLLLAALGCVGITLGLFEALKSTVPYKEGVARVQADPRARAALGEPIQPEWWVNGSLEDRGNHANAHLLIPLRGPRGSATLDLAASKSQGTWTLGRALLTVEASGEVLDLLQTPARGTPSPSPSPR